MKQHCKWIAYGTDGLGGKGCTRLRPKLHRASRVLSIDEGAFQKSTSHGGLCECLHSGYTDNTQWGSALHHASGTVI